MVHTEQSADVDKTIISISSEKINRDMYAEGLHAVSISVVFVCLLCTFTPCQTQENDPEQASVQEVCDLEADVVFVVDSSGSVGETNFRRVLDFVVNVTQNWDIGPHATQVAMETFATTPLVHYYLDTYHDLKSLLNATAVLPYVSGGTNTAQALAFMRNVMFNVTHGHRNDVIKIGVVITDGGSSNAIATATEASWARADGVVLLAVGVGNARYSELKAIATDPDSQNVFNVTHFTGLAEIANRLRQATCRARPICSKIQNIIFLLDISSDVDNDVIQQLPHFVANVSRGWDVGRGKVRVGVMTFADVVDVRVGLEKFDSKDMMLTAISKLQLSQVEAPSRLASALRFAKDLLYNTSNGNASDVENIAIIVTGGKTSDVDMTQSVASDVKEAGLVLITLGVGRNRSGALMERVASGPDVAFINDDFSDWNQTVQLVQRKVCNGLDEVTKECRHSSTTIIGLAVNIGCLAFTALLYLLVPKCRQGISQGTLFNMALAILGSWTILLIKGVTHVTSDVTVCLSLGALLHYFIMASFVWVLAESVLQYVVVVTTVKKFALKVAFFAWVAPAAPVVVVLVKDRYLYTEANTCCWMPEEPFPFYHTLVYPVGGLVAVCVVMDVMVTLTLCCSCGRKVKADIVASVVCQAGLVGSWVLAYYVIIKEENDVLHYVFVVVVAMLGVIVLVVFIGRSCAVSRTAGNPENQDNPSNLDK